MREERERMNMSRRQRGRSTAAISEEGILSLLTQKNM